MSQMQPYQIDSRKIPTAFGSPGDIRNQLMAQSIIRSQGGNVDLQDLAQKANQQVAYQVPMGQQNQLKQGNISYLNKANSPVSQNTQQQQQQQEFLSDSKINPGDRIKLVQSPRLVQGQGQAYDFNNKLQESKMQPSDNNEYQLQQIGRPSINKQPIMQQIAQRDSVTYQDYLQQQQQQQSQGQQPPINPKGAQQMAPQQQQQQQRVSQQQQQQQQQPQQQQQYQIQNQNDQQQYQYSQKPMQQKQQLQQSQQSLQQQKMQSPAPHQGKQFNQRYPGMPQTQYVASTSAQTNPVQNHQNQQPQDILKQRRTQYDAGSSAQTPLKVQDENQSNIKQMMSPQQQGYSTLQGFHSPVSNKGQQMMQQQLQQFQSPNAMSNSQIMVKRDPNEDQRMKQQIEQYQMEIRKQRENNSIFQQRITQLEQQLQKAPSQSEFADLTQKMKIIIQANDKLQSENERLVLVCNQRNAGQLDKFEYERKIIEQNQQMDQIQLQLNEYKHDSAVWKQRSEDLEKTMQIQHQQIQQLQQQQAQTQNGNQGYSEGQIKGLVSDLEIKVASLIQENERLNLLLQDRMREIEQINAGSEQLQIALQENQRLQSVIKVHNQEVEVWKKKYDDLEKKLFTIVQQEGSIEEYKERVDDLESKIKILIEENDKLNSVINENIKASSTISVLEQKIQLLMDDNAKLEDNIKGWQNKQDDFQGQIDQNQEGKKLSLSIDSPTKYEQIYQKLKDQEKQNSEQQ